MIGRARSSASFLSISQTIFLRLVEVGLLRLLVDQRVHVLVAVLREVALRVAAVVLVEIDVGVVDADAGQIEADANIPRASPWRARCWCRPPPARRRCGSS